MAETNFQKYMKENFDSNSIVDSEVMRKIELAAAIDKLLTEHEYEYTFHEKSFTFVLNTLHADLNFIKFTINYCVTPPYIYVAIRPDVDLSGKNVDLVKEVVQEFRNTLNYGTFGISEKNDLVFHAYTDWYWGVPEKPFIDYLLELPMLAWVSCLDVILQSAEGAVDVDGAKQKMHQAQEDFRQEYVKWRSKKEGGQL